MSNCANCKNAPHVAGKDSGMMYRTFEEAGVTKATLYGVRHNLSQVLSKLVNNNSNFFSLWSCDVDLMLNDTYTGKSRVNTTEGDVFNEEQGRILAHDRAMTKYHNAFDKRMCAVVEDLHRLTAAVIHYCEKKHINLEKVPTVEDFLFDMQAPEDKINVITKTFK